MATTYLSKTFGGSADKKKWTWSAWVKRGKLGTGQPLFYADDGSANYTTFMRFRDTDQFDFSNQWAGSNDAVLLTNRKFRDPSAWIHLQVVWDSNNSTAADRQILYINGVRETSFATETTSNQNRSSTINDGYEHRIGRGINSFTSDYFDGNMTHIHFANGQAYAPTVFGESDSTSGIWKPKTAPSVTYGTNGFFLKFENSGAMGTDSSGNSFNWTVNGTLTQNVDTPSNNFATLNPLIYSTSNGTTLSNGNLTVTSSGASHKNAFSNFGVQSGKWYAEIKVVTLNTHQKIGVASDDNEEINKTSPSEFSGNANGYAYRNDGQKEGGGGSISSFGNTYTAGDIIGVAMDLDNSKLYFSKNGVFQNSGDPTSGSTGTGAAFTLSSNKTYFLAINHYNSNVSNFNFGKGYFGTTQVSSAQADDGGLGIMEYDVPANYRVWCTKNIKDYG